MADTIGLLTTLSINDGSSAAQTEILNVLAMTPPAPSVEMIDAMILNQAGGSALAKRVRTKKPGLITAGTFSFTVKHDSTERARMITQWSLTLNDTCPIFRITWTDTTTHTFSAWVVKVGNAVVIDQINQYTVDCEVNSLITVA